MTIKLLDLYNLASSQEWSMYDTNVSSKDEFEQPLLIALNKAVCEILYSYPFNFRDKMQVFVTLPNEQYYDLPDGIIKKNCKDSYSIRLNSKLLNYIEKPELLHQQKGLPTGFYIKGDKLVLYPTPTEKFIITIDYTTLAIGENKDGEEIFTLSDENDILSIPTYLEELFKNAVISRTMLNTIASESDENYSSYKKQSEVAYRLLVKYSKGVWQDKKIKI